MIWFLEGQSSQRDVIISAREALPAQMNIIASHRQHRPEITTQASVSLQEPLDDAERIDWILHTAREYGISVIIAGRIGSFYEHHRHRFIEHGIDLVTGGLSLDTFIKVDDKSRFTAAAEAAGLCCVPAITVHNAQELISAYTTLSPMGDVCIKPAVGIYGQGFWRFSSTVDDFRCFANPDARETTFAAYLHAYQQRPEPPVMLVMPYMTGSECSVDMVCEQGKVVASVGRRKQGLTQRFERGTAAVRLAEQAAEHFKCDGLVNVQTRDNQHGQPHLLEINPRYSGGIGYTRHAGVNLPGIFATRRLGLTEPATLWRDGVSVKSVTIAVATTS